MTMRSNFKIFFKNIKNIFLFLEQSFYYWQSMIFVLLFFYWIKIQHSFNILLLLLA